MTLHTLATLATALIGLGAAASIVHMARANGHRAMRALRGELQP